MSIKSAAKVLTQGGIIAYPTEAVYGFGCEPMNQAAVLRLLKIKQRPIEKGLIIIAANLKQLAPYIEDDVFAQYPNTVASWPGPYTWLLPCKPNTPSWLTGEHSTLAVRVTAHPVAAKLCEQFGAAITSTSANKSNHDPVKSYTEAQRLFTSDLDYILQGDIGDQNQVTTITDAISGHILR